MTFQILLAAEDLEFVELDFLLRGPKQVTATSPFDWLSHSSWQMVRALSSLPNNDTFKTLASDIEGSAKQWKKYCENEVWQYIDIRFLRTKNYRKSGKTRLQCKSYVYCAVSDQIV